MIVEIQIDRCFFLSSTWPPFSRDVLCNVSRRRATGNRKDILWESVLRPVRRERKGEKCPEGKLKMKEGVREDGTEWKPFDFSILHEFLLILAETSFCNVLLLSLRGDPVSRDTRSRYNWDISGFVDKIAHFRVHF